MASSTPLKRVIVKIGSRALRQSPTIFADIAAAADQAFRSDQELVVVSSGAVRFGSEVLGFKERPQDLSRLQAAASIGQPILMDAYRNACGAYGLAAGQLLLTRADFRDRERYLNARSALESLLAFRCLPVVNENDAVGTSEIEFGDNDQLAAMVANLVDADLLVMLSSVDGLLDASGAVVSEVSSLQQAIALVSDEKTAEGLGGMKSKLEAAFRASERGTPVLIGNAFRAGGLQRILEGKALGTRIVPKENKIAARKHWLAFATRPDGALVLDTGATRALLHSNASLLAVGIAGVRGRFEAGDVVNLETLKGDEIGRGLVRQSLPEVARLASEYRDISGSVHGGNSAKVVVHRDDLVLFANFHVGPQD